MFDVETDLTDQRRMAGKYFGKYPGLVMENTPPPDGTAHRGELKVKVPGILEEPDGANPKPIEVVAKPNFLPGFFFIPEVGAQVWVEFLAGDINCPIWTGVWYPNDASPKTSEGEAPTEFQKVIRTASGHVVELDDTEGQEKIDISHASGARLMIDRNGSVLLVAGNKSFVFINAEADEVTILDKVQNLISLKGTGIVVGNKENTVIELNNNKKLRMSSAGSVQLTAPEVIIDGGTISLGGSNALPSSILLASKFLTLFDTHVHGHPMGPTSTPLVPMSTMLSQLTSQIVKAG